MQRLLAAIEQRTGLTPSGVVVLGVAALAWIPARMLGSRALSLLAAAGVFVAAVSWLLVRRGTPIEAERSRLPSRIREGQPVDVGLIVTPKRTISTAFLEEQLPEGIGATVHVPIPTLPAGSALEHRYSFQARTRGVYRIGPLALAWADPLGLVRRRIVLAEAVEVIVHPSTETVHDRVLTRLWEDPPVRPPVSKPWPTGFEFYGMRDYVPGDDPRRIVWRAVARTGRYLVREAEQGITDRVTIVLDTDARWHSPELPSETFETAVRVAASLGARHLKDGFAVTVQTGSGVLVDSVRGERMRIALLDELASIQPSAQPLAAALEGIMRRARRDTHTIVITPHVDEASSGRLQMILARGGSAAVVKILWEGTEAESMDRVTALGCQVVEVRPQTPLEGQFRRAVGAGLR